MQIDVPDEEAITLVFRDSRWWQIGQEFKLTVDGVVYTVRKHDLCAPYPGEGNATDLASVPRPLWSLIGPYGTHLKAALLHDQLCNEAGDQDGLRRQADSLFRRALRDAGMGEARRWIMWAGVRLGAQKGAGRVTLLGLTLLAAAVGLSRFWWVVACRGVMGAAALPGRTETLACPAPGDAWAIFTAVAVAVSLLWWRWAQGSVFIVSLFAPFVVVFFVGFGILWLVMAIADCLSSVVHTNGYRQREQQLQALPSQQPT